MLDFPVPRKLSDAGVRARGAIIDAIRSLEREEDHEDLLPEVRRVVSEQALSLYNLDDWERDLVADCISSAPTVAFGGGRLPKVVEVAAANDCSDYLSRLTSALRSWSPTNEALSGQAFISRSAQFGVVLLRRSGADSAPQIETLEDDDELSEILGRLREIASKRYGWSSTPANLMMFDGQALYITKPLGKRHWTRTAALNDADTLVAELLGRSH